MSYYVSRALEKDFHLAKLSHTDRIASGHSKDHIFSLNQVHLGFPLNSILLFHKDGHPLHCS